MKLQIEYIPLAEIKPYPNNPRKNDKAVEIVKKSIKEFGFRNPIILDKSNEIIAGHTRLNAAKQLGMTEVPVIWADDLDPEQIKAFRIMDNKSTEFADWDFEVLKGEFHILETEFEFDTSLTGFDSDEITKIYGSDEIKTEKEFNENLETKNKCPKCGYEF